MPNGKRLLVAFSKLSSYADSRSCPGTQGTASAVASLTIPVGAAGCANRVTTENVSLASNGQGEFFINDLEAGSYTLAVTYVGFKAFTTPV